MGQERFELSIYATSRHEEIVKNRTQKRRIYSHLNLNKSHSLRDRQGHEVAQLISFHAPGIFTLEGLGDI